MDALPRTAPRHTLPHRADRFGPRRCGRPLRALAPLDRVCAMAHLRRHWVELFFLNWLRPRLPAERWAQIGGRLLVWIVGGTVLMVGARFTALSLGIPALRVPPWALGGPIFVGVELFVHALSQVRAQPNFFNGLR